MPASIRSRILLAVALPAVLILGVASLLLHLWLRHEGLANVDNSLATRAAAMAALVELEDGEWDVDFGSERVPATELFGALATYEVRVVPSGRLLGRKGAAGERSSPQGTASDAASLPPVPQVFDLGGRSADRPLQLSGDATTVGAGPDALRTWTGVYLVRAHGEGPDNGPEGSETDLTDSDGAPPVVRIVVAQSLSPLTTSLRQILLVQVSTGLLLSGCALLAGWVLSRTIVDPIDRIARAAEGVSVPTPHPPLRTDGTGDEIDRLVGSLNRTFVRLHHAFALQARFTSDASHELRTPVAVILSQTEVALRRQHTIEEYRATLSAVLAGATRMQDVLEALLVLARADAGTPLPTRDSFDLADLAREVGAAVTRDGRGARLRVEAGRAAWVEGDRRQLEIALRNVLSNALRHTPETGVVVVRLAAEGAEVLLEVVDNGEGIPAEALPRVFERFFRVDDARSRQNGGSGLGLSIVKAVIEQHGGTVAAESTLGVGTTIRIRLPRPSVEPTDQSRMPYFASL